MKIPMWAHFLLIISAIAVVILCTLLPFLPGPYDPLALPLSMMARVAGFFSLLFAPIGVLWMASRYSRVLAAKQHTLAVAALSVLSLVWATVSLAAFALGSLLLALLCLALGVYVVVSVKPRLKGLKMAPTSTAAPALYFLVVPVAVFLLQQVVLEPAVQFSRNRAMNNSAQLISDIQQYRAARGHYPPSLLSVNKDYKPGVIGIEKFHYEPSGDAFNLLFEQPASPLGTQEFVVYNPRGEQTATSHAMDILQYTPQTLERARGYYAMHDVPHTRWKYFWFD
ncbi:MAG TPA: hypothetical protein VEW46_11935 [Pyrinomonadaceae bacterium]|nr:hypothetical protein [Pyrinomonadaceae bacterium]